MSWRASYPPFSIIFFFYDPTTTEIYTLSLHDALPICSTVRCTISVIMAPTGSICALRAPSAIRRMTSLRDRKSTRLNSSHQIISYAVFCLKKKKQCGYSEVLEPEREHRLAVLLVGPRL